MYFLVLFCVERNLLYYKSFYFVKCFLKVFLFFVKIKISNYLRHFLKVYFITNSFVLFIIFSLAKYLFILAQIVDICQ